MAKYIQGNDIHIHLGDTNIFSSFAVASQGAAMVFYFVVSGMPAIGDKIKVVLDDGDGTIETYVVKAENTILADVIELLRLAINESEIFTSTTMLSGGVGLEISADSDSVTGTVSIENFIDTTVLACTKSDVLNGENEMLEITEIELNNTNYIPTFQSLSLAIEQAVVVDVAGKVATDQLEDWFLQQTRLKFQFIRPNGPSIRVISGFCYIKGESIQGGVNTSGLATFDMVCIGKPKAENILITYPLTVPTIDASSFYATAVYFYFTGDANTEGFVLERATNSSFTTGLTTVYTGAGPTYTDSGLTPGTTYYYRIVATSTNPVYTNSPYAYITRTTLLAKLAAPNAETMIVTALWDPGYFSVLWDTVTNANYYTITLYTNPEKTTVYNGWNPSQDGTGQQLFRNLGYAVAAGNYYLTVQARTFPQTHEDSDETAYPFNPITII